MILVVDDDADIREAVCLFLQEDGYRTARACNGKEALDSLLSEEAPSAILLDIQMPVMDGYQFLTAKDAHPDLVDVPVVVMTALQDRSRLLADARVTQCLPKPLSPGDLLEAVERATRSSHGRRMVPAAQTSFRFAALPYPRTA
jgi:CheY-like chemotaxis protein